MMKGHLEASLQEDLDEIRQKVVEMGGLAEGAVGSSIRAVLGRDRHLAYAVILRDRYIDEVEKQLDRLCLRFLVRHQPAAGLLRFAYTSIRINLELERVGDYAEAIAREALRLSQIETPLPLDRLQQIADLAEPMLHDAIQSFIDQDAELASKIIETDEAVDLVRDKLIKDFTRDFREGQLPFEALYPLIMVIRRLERVSDQARNISLETLYLCTGEIAKHPRSGALQVLFVDERSSCRSLMAEYIGNSLSEPGFAFSSAGLEPLPIGRATAGFMASKGFDITRAVPRAVTSVENLDHQDVIVLLAPEARRAFPRRPRKAVLLEWPLEDPSLVQGTEVEVRTAYEKAYTFIEGQIRDLVSAIRDTGRP
ncbi:MAG: phosphate signaling complex protein PhoU [Candidatus Eisenbacteria bacterium]|uniref:Phosphate signaling complex protein PhoU n=1 Tax=Eiseniibacteriota bacterium TaxID=2212470 RepID=A0A538S9Z5_UNCEI|nr:MAG: phosphate signaling complex protein PhoU [Candidatus Eisenbacteria bacterium]